MEISCYEYFTYNFIKRRILAICLKFGIADIKVKWIILMLFCTNNVGLIMFYVLQTPYQ